MKSVAITTAESKRLVELEEIIEKGINTFKAVGAALAEIRDKELFRSSHDNFEDYCREEWEMSHWYAHKVIASAAVASVLDNCPTQPKTESQARPLTKLETPVQQQAAWKAAVQVSEGKPTAKHVEAAVKAVQSVPLAPIRPVEDIVKDAVSRIRPMISTFPAEMEARAAEAEKDSDKLWTAKRYARNLSRKDKAALVDWINGSLIVKPIAELDATTEQLKPSALPRYRPSNGLQYATMATISLEKIHKNDTQRAEAFALITRWIEANRK